MFGVVSIVVAGVAVISVVGWDFRSTFFSLFTLPTHSFIMHWLAWHWYLYNCWICLKWLWPWRKEYRSLLLSSVSIHMAIYYYSLVTVSKSQPPLIQRSAVADQHVCRHRSTGLIPVFFITILLFCNSTLHVACIIKASVIVIVNGERDFLRVNGL